MGRRRLRASSRICATLCRIARSTITPSMRAFDSTDNARVTSLGLRTRSVVTRIPSSRPAFSLADTIEGEAAGGASSTNCVALGTAARRYSTRLAAISLTAADSPVVLPPGWARLWTKPSPIGSPAKAITMGIFDVAFCTARTAGVVAATITSTFWRTISAASPESWSMFPSACRASIPAFFPSS